VRDTGDDDGVARELNSLGVTRWAMSEPDAATALLEESAATARRSDNQPRLASALSNLGMVALSLNDVDGAVRRFEEAMQIDEALDDRWGVACDRTNLGAALVRTGDVDRAHRMLVDVLPTSIELDDPDLLASTIEGIVLAAATTGHFHHALILAAAADKIREDAKIPRAPFDDANLERGLGPARASLTSEEVTEAQQLGRALTTEQVAEVASRPIP
jgi:tetratricopeptide (TPR) repeat protein